MQYLNPTKTESGAYSSLQSTPAEGLLLFDDAFLPEFFKEGKMCAGFVSITDDGTRVTSCTWDEASYQAYVQSMPNEPEPLPEEPSVWDEMAAAYKEGVQNA